MKCKLYLEDVHSHHSIIEYFVDYCFEAEFFFHYVYFFGASQGIAKTESVSTLDRDHVAHPELKETMP